MALRSDQKLFKSYYKVRYYNILLNIRFQGNFEILSRCSSSRLGVYDYLLPHQVQRWNCSISFDYFFFSRGQLIGFGEILYIFFFGYIRLDALFLVLNLIEK
jgi:hypothetical protein